MAKTRDLDRAVALFSAAMRERLHEKEEDGWEGWDSKRAMYDRGPWKIKERIIRNLLEGDWVDVANLAMFAWNLEE